jgi:hypothetical protein
LSNALEVMADAGMREFASPSRRSDQTDDYELPLLVSLSLGWLRLPCIEHFDIQPAGNTKEAFREGNSRMKRLGCILALALAVTALVPIAFGQECGPGEGAALRAILKDKKLAQENPDEFNWRVLALISTPVKSRPFVASNHQTLTPNNVLWETWADDAYTFPRHPDTHRRPTWCGRNSNIELQPDPLMKFFVERPVEHELIGGGFQDATAPPDSSGEEVRRNKDSFQFIMNNGLWYQEGLAKAGFDAQGKRRKTTLKFPGGSIEIKAFWMTISDSQKGSYHWNYGHNGKLYGLHSLHIITKTLDHWTWATWEHIDNVPRCDVIGCFDSFGSIPHVVPSGEVPAQGYPPGQLTPELLKVLRHAGVRPEWQNYRLKGSQVDPLNRQLLGNSIMEGKYLSTGSCISCHSRASIRCTGQADSQLGFNPDHTGPNGVLEQLPADEYATGFVWAFFLAKPVNPNSVSCQPAAQ